MDNIREQLREKIFSKYRKDTWEIKTLGEIAIEIISGTEVTREQLRTGDYPAIKAGDLNSGLKIKFSECKSFVDEKLIKKKVYFEKGDLLISKLSNKAETLGISTYLGDEKGILGEGVVTLKHNQNPLFLSFVCSSNFVREQIKERAQDGTVFNFYVSEIKKIKIPLPSLEIQNQISDFLDKFLELERELKIEWEKESEKRKLQYEYYRELLFNRGLRELNWPIKTVEDIALEIISGTGVTREQLGTGDHPAIKCGDINSQLPLSFEECISFVDQSLIKKPKYFEHGDLLLSNMSNKVETIGTPVVYLGKDKCLAGDHVIVIKTNQNTKFLAYVLSSDYAKSQIKNLAQKSTVYDLYVSKIKQIKVPVPTPEEQERIVEILDRLHGISNNIKEGIPFLIQKNRERYEFYRELLLEK